MQDETIKNRRFWTAEEIGLVKQWRKDGIAWRHIDRRLNREDGASADKMSRIRGGFDRDLSVAEVVEEVPRKCSCCGKGFVAPSRFIRICPQCKDTDLFKGSGADTGFQIRYDRRA